MLRRGVTILLGMLVLSLNSQSSIESILNTIEVNNKEIAAYSKYVHAKSLEIQSGLNPDNPFISTDYMNGRPASGGNQLDVLVSQSVEFPTTYIHKKAIANQKVEILENEYQDLKRTILGEARNLCIDLISLQKRKEILDTRLKLTDSLLSKFQLKYSLGEISLLDLNKVNSQRIKIISSSEQVKSQTLSALLKLKEMNGGIEIVFDVNEFSQSAIDLSKEALLDSIKSNSFKIKSLEQQQQMDEQNISLRKSQSLPDFEIGYHHQSVLGQTFNGAHFGISIPIWEHKNEIKTAKAYSEFHDTELEEFNVTQESELEILYSRYLSLNNTLKQYKLVLNDNNTEELLNQSYEQGDINLITYIMELEYIYSLQDDFISIENEFQLVMSQLTIYKL